MMIFVLKTRNCVSKTRIFVFKMMNSAGQNLTIIKPNHMLSSCQEYAIAHHYCGYQ